MMFKFCNLDFHGGKLATFLIFLKRTLYFRGSHINNEMNRIGKILKEKGLKQNWLADQLGMSSVMINLYTKNKTQPKLETLIKISKVLQVELTQLVDTSDS